MYSTYSLSHLNVLCSLAQDFHDAIVFVAISEIAFELRERRDTPLREGLREKFRERERERKRERERDRE